MIGETVGKYTLESVLGTGGMAKVYLGYRQDINLYAAIKVLNPDKYSNETLRERFLREAKAVVKVKHRHILPIYDFGHEKDRKLLYIIMPNMEGGTLSNRIQEGSLSLSEISRILEQVGSALDFAHGKGLFHRDIKPSNIIIDEKGDYFLSDFGIVKDVASDEPTLTGTEHVIGTPYYMSPEQGLGIDLSNKSDIYSLGVVLFEMLTGKLPYDEGTVLKIIQSHCEDPIPEISSLREDPGGVFQDLIEKAMAKKPEERFSSCRELRLEFDKARRLSQNIMAQVATKHHRDEEMQQRILEASQKIEKEKATIQNSAKKAEKIEIPTAPLGYVNVHIEVQDKPNLSTVARVKRNVELRALLKKVCKDWRISSSNKAFVFNGQVLNLDRTVGQNGVPQKAHLLIVEHRPVKSRTWEWIRANTEPKQFEKTTMIYLLEEASHKQFRIEFQPAIIGRYDASPPHDISYINNYLSVDLTRLDTQTRVSRQHAAITRSGGQYYIENLRENNRTYLNDQKLRHAQRYPLQAGDGIRVGGVRLIFQID